MKKRHVGLVAAAAALALTITGCSAGGSSDTPAENTNLSVALSVNGALGDQGFFDEAETGMVELKKLGHNTTTLQADINNPAQWKSNLESLSTGKWDIAVAGTHQMVDPLTAIAAKFPKQKYLFFDAIVEAPNVASITYAQNEGSYLAGVLAATAATDTANFPLSSGSKTIGLVGGMDTSVINDFLAGFKAGAEAVDPSVNVLVSYVGAFNDSAKGYDQAMGMYNQGADVVFQVAGGSGNGVLQAAKDANKYAIGVNSNQNALQPGHILASMEKRIGNSIVLAVQSAQDGTLEWGKTVTYGLANDGVGLNYADNDNIVPDSVIKIVDGFKKQIIDGSVTVPTAF